MRGTWQSSGVRRPPGVALANLARPCRHRNVLSSALYAVCGPATCTAIGHSRLEKRSCCRAVQNVVPPPVSTRNLSRGLGRISGSNLGSTPHHRAQLALEQALGAATFPGAVPERCAVIR